MAYEAPNWRNDTSPYINASNLQAISDTLENVPVANGGTGKQSHTVNAVLAGNGTDPVKNVSSANGALYATGSNQLPQFGVLPVAQGGTGQSSLQAFRNSLGLGNTTGALPVANGGTSKTSHTVNAVLTGNGTSAVKNVPSANGALYATGSGAAPQFGVLPVAQGGTGGTSVATARYNLGLGDTAGALPIQNGGTGASTVAAARNNLGLGNTSGALPVANGGTGVTGVETATVLTGGGISSGWVYKWGKIVTVNIHTSPIAKTGEYIVADHCIPAGFRPPRRTWISFLGGDDQSSTGRKTVGSMAAYIEPDGQIMGLEPNATGRGFYHATVTYLLE